MEALGRLSYSSFASHPIMWYVQTMPPQKKSTSKKRTSTKLVIGRERFARISAVEGIKLSPAMKKRLARFDRAGLTAAERRREIIKVYQKG